MVRFEREEDYFSTDLLTHCEDTTKLCMKLARMQHRSKEELCILETAAKYHDIGKYYIPDEVLNAKHPLTETERTVIDFHSQFGYLQMKELGHSEEVCQLVLLHHGMKKYRTVEDEFLCFSARSLYPILMISDIYAALTVDRVYRKAMTKEEAFEIIEKIPEIPQSLCVDLKRIIEKRA